MSGLSGQPYRDWWALLDPLRNRPGDWAVIKETDTPREAGNTAYKLKISPLVNLLPGPWEFKSRQTAKGGGKVYARYLGPRPSETPVATIHWEAPLAVRKSHSGVDPARVFAEYVHSQNTIRELADQFGLSYQRVHQIVEKFDPSGTARQACRNQRKERRKQEALTQELLNRAMVAKPCRVCGSWVLRGQKSVTCSHECAELWRRATVRKSFALRRHDGDHS